MMLTIYNIDVHSSVAISFFAPFPLRFHARTLYAVPTTRLALFSRYIMADVSGAHLNPAVSMGLMVGKRISVERFIIYLIAQV